jgi:hypothetical protein
LGVPLERSTRRILLIAIRVLQLLELDLQLAWRVRVSFAMGVELTAESMHKKYFARIHKAPIGSFVEMTPNAYTTNEV